MEMDSTNSRAHGESAGRFWRLPMGDPDPFGTIVDGRAAAQAIVARPVL
jgi:hypothetical protein